jgi:hypothetical protein
MMSFLEQKKRKTVKDAPGVFYETIFVYCIKVTAFIHRHRWAILLSSTSKCVGLFQHNLPIFATTMTHWQTMKNDTEILRLLCKTCLARDERSGVGEEGVGKLDRHAVRATVKILISSCMKKWVFKTSKRFFFSWCCRWRHGNMKPWRLTSYIRVSFTFFDLNQKNVLNFWEMICDVPI